MRKYIVRYWEEVCYEQKVEGKSKEDIKERFYRGEIDEGEATEGNIIEGSLEIGEVEE